MAHSKKTLTIKKGDVVRVISGKDKGAEGKVIGVLRDQNRLIVEGVNRVKRHTRLVNQGGRAGTTGGIITQEASIHASNVMLLTEVGGKKVPTRVGAKRVDVTKTRGDGTTYAAQRSVRVAAKNGEEV
jgi:large subunit ribosomal protein L24